MNHSNSDLRARLLNEALRLVPFDGWNINMLHQAARSCEGNEAAADVAFPGGVEEAVELFLIQTDRRMETALAERGLSSMKIRQRIATAVRTRLELLAEHKEALRRALAFLLLPTQAGLAMRCQWRTVDAMWHAAGDTSTDFNYYTKRLLLGKVYSATLLYWLNDDSPAHEETWAFLDRRIENVMQIEKLKGRVKTGWANLAGHFKPNATKR